MIWEAKDVYRIAGMDDGCQKTKGKKEREREETKGK